MSGSNKQLSPSAREALPDCVGGQPRHLGQLGCVEVVQVAEQHQRSVLRAERSFQQIAESENCVCLVAQLTSDRQPVDRALKAPPFAQRIQRTVSSDPKQPCLGVRDGLKIGTCTKSDDERVLEEVLGEAAVAHHLCEVAAKALLALREQRLELLALAGCAVVRPEPATEARHDATLRRSAHTYKVPIEGEL